MCKALAGHELLLLTGLPAPHMLMQAHEASLHDGLVCQLQACMPSRPSGPSLHVCAQSPAYQPSDEQYAFKCKSRPWWCPLLQVHKACLHDGRVVAVKVQYLGLESEVAADMTTLAALSTLAGWLFPDSFREYQRCAGGTEGLHAGCFPGVEL